MRLYVMRHGPAEDRAPSGRDRDRPLTHAGRDVVRRSVDALHQARGGERLRIISSPYRRAHETAELVAAVIGSGDLELHDDLAADADVPFALVRDVHAAGHDAVLVGHQPIVEELVRALVHGAGHGEASLRAGFRTATIASLERAGDGWRLSAVIDPHATP